MERQRTVVLYLHTKFQELYEEAALHVDEIAEHILTLKGKPLATMRDYLEHASAKEATNAETAEEMVDSLINDFNSVLANLKEGMQIAEQHDDETTSDMFLAIFTAVEKHVWMLSAFNNR